MILLLNVKKLYPLIFLGFCACTAGPNYIPPAVIVPMQYKEAPPGFKIAEPRDDLNKGPWWTVFGDPLLNALEEKLLLANQNIAAAEANYWQARALVDEARAGFFPILSASAAIERQKSAGGSDTLIATNDNGQTTSDTVTTGGSKSKGSITNTHTLIFNTAWEPDIWGQVRRTVEASASGAMASKALWAATTLSQAALLAQTYFQLRHIDRDQQILDETVIRYQKTLKLTLNRYRAGIIARADVVQAETQVQAAMAQAIDNGINRAKFEHAIAVLIGELPETFSLLPNPLNLPVPTIPLVIPSTLLERRPDIAQAERLVAQANAQIGIAVAAYYPSLMLTATGTFSGSGFGPWLSNFGWALGAELSEIILDGGLRNAAVKAAKANHASAVAAYRQVILTAFQNVEDNLAALRILAEEHKVQTQAKDSASLALKLVVNQYKAGILQFTDVLLAEIILYNAQQSLSNIEGQQMLAAVGLIQALGGGWDTIFLTGSAGRFDLLKAVTI